MLRYEQAKCKCRTLSDVRIGFRPTLQTDNEKHCEYWNSK